MEYVSPSLSTIEMVTGVCVIGTLTHVCWGWQRTVQVFFAAMNGHFLLEWHRVRQVQKVVFES